MKALGENLFFFFCFRINTRRYLKSKASFLQHIFPNWKSARRALRKRCARSSGCRAIGKTELLSREARWPFADTERLISLKIRKFGLSNMRTEIKPCPGGAATSRRCAQTPTRSPGV